MIAFSFVNLRSLSAFFVPDLKFFLYCPLYFSIPSNFCCASIFILLRLVVMLGYNCVEKLLIAKLLRASLAVFRFLTGIPRNIRKHSIKLHFNFGLMTNENFISSKKCYEQIEYLTNRDLYCL